MGSPSFLIAWGLSTTLPRSTWSFYYRIMVVDNHVIVGRTEMGSQSHNLQHEAHTFATAAEAQEDALRRTQDVEEKGYVLVDDPLWIKVDWEEFSSIADWLSGRRTTKPPGGAVDIIYERTRRNGKSVEFEVS